MNVNHLQKKIESFFHSFLVSFVLFQVGKIKWSKRKSSQSISQRLHKVNKTNDDKCWQSPEMGERISCNHMYVLYYVLTYIQEESRRILCSVLAGEGLSGDECGGMKQYKGAEINAQRAIARFNKSCCSSSDSSWRETG